MSLFELTDHDREFYESRLAGFLPDRIIDVHSHCWLEEFLIEAPPGPERGAHWPARVARENPFADLDETYRLLFPGKECTAVTFGYPERRYDVEASNSYVGANAGLHGHVPLLLTRPEWTADELSARLGQGVFLGAKVYLNFAPEYLPADELRILDFAPHHQLEVLDARGAILILHIPRPGRLKDPVNLRQLLEIEHRYRNLQIVVAHVGRAYCDPDVGDAFEQLAGAERLMFDISANTNSRVFEQALRAVGPKRLLFGSDLPITRMRMRRTCVAGNYVNIVPRGLYGDVSQDPSMQEAGPDEAGRLTFFLYEEIDAFRRAADAAGLTAQDVEDVFHGNATRCIEHARNQAGRSQE